MYRMTTVDKNRMSGMRNRPLFRMRLFKYVFYVREKDLCI